LGIGLLAGRGRQEAGAGESCPVATVILGGLVTSTFCEFLLHPGLFWRFSGKDAERLVHSEGSEEELLRAGA
jgi:HME family heavy-metal exporter